MGSPASMRASLHEDVALEWHLQYNHYPPIDVRAVPLAKAAIAHARECADNWDAPYNWGCEHTTADLDECGVTITEEPLISDLLDAWHLWDFISMEEE